MILYPRYGSTGQSLLEAVTRVGNTVRNAGSGPNPVESYLEWAAEAERTCRRAMRRPDLERLILTPRYWATLSNPDCV
ncbi:MAG: hypothetical protein QOJ80_3345 [Mycobacterium sp.]|jgi:hypothetical protein|nr:hypothetical protein [Mycobacterium sp.]